MAFLPAIAAPLLGSAVGPVVQSVLGTVVGAAAQGAMQAATGVVGGQAQAVGGVATGLQTVFGGIQEAFGKLFGNKDLFQHDHMHTCPNRPPAVGGGSIPGNVMQNPMKFLQGLQNMFQQIGGLLQNLMKQFQFPGLQPGFPGMPAFPGMPGGFPGMPGGFPGAGGIGGGFSPGGAGGPGSVGGGVGGGEGRIGGGDYKFLDNMQGQIESLMQSENPSDQIKAQQLMNKLNRIVDSITTLLSKQRDIQSKIAQNLAK